MKEEELKFLRPKFDTFCGVDKVTLVTDNHPIPSSPYEYWVERQLIEKWKYDIERLRKSLMSLGWFDKHREISELKVASDVFKTLDWLYSTIHIGNGKFIILSTDGLKWLSDLRLVLGMED